jgi:hypothetical protein
MACWLGRRISPIDPEGTRRYFLSPLKTLYNQDVIMSYILPWMVSLKFEIASLFDKDYVVSHVAPFGLVSALASTLAAPQSLGVLISSTCFAVSFVNNPGIEDFRAPSRLCRLPESSEIMHDHPTGT